MREYPFKNLLYAEDSELISILIIRALEMKFEDIRIIRCEDGVDAWYELRNKQRLGDNLIYHAVLVSESLSTISGLEFAEITRASDINIPIILHADKYGVCSDHITSMVLKQNLYGLVKEIECCLGF